MLETLEPGTELDGIVRNVRDFGAFVDIGNGVEGLVHVSQLSWDRVANPADVLQPGQQVRVIVKNEDVLDTLATVAGVNFGWDLPAWRAWLASRDAPADLDLRRW
jgi:transcriptional accessory protein Tex/SPT6